MSNLGLTGDSRDIQAHVGECRRAIVVKLVKVGAQRCPASMIPLVSLSSACAFVSVTLTHYEHMTQNSRG